MFSCCKKGQQGHREEDINDILPPAPRPGVPPARTASSKGARGAPPSPQSQAVAARAVAPAGRRPLAIHRGIIDFAMLTDLAAVAAAVEPRRMADVERAVAAVPLWAGGSVAMATEDDLVVVARDAQLVVVGGIPAEAGVEAACKVLKAIERPGGRATSDDMRLRRLHAGAVAIAERADKALARHLRKGLPTIVVGHGLAGAAAVILGLLLADRGMDVAQIVSFGASRVGPGYDCDPLRPLPVLRVTHRNDMTPHFPPMADWGNVGDNVVFLDENATRYMHVSKQALEVPLKEAARAWAALPADTGRTYSLKQYAALLSFVDQRSIERVAADQKALLQPDASSEVYEEVYEYEEDEDDADAGDDEDEYGEDEYGEDEYGEEEEEEDVWDNDSSYGSSFASSEVDDDSASSS